MYDVFLSRYQVLVAKRVILYHNVMIYTPLKHFSATITSNNGKILVYNKNKCRLGMSVSFKSDFD